MKDNKPNHSQFIQALSEGRKSAYEQLYIHYYKDLCMYASRILDDIEDSKDVVQHVITKIWENHAALANVKDIKYYLFRAVHNGSINKISRDKTSSDYKDELWHEIKDIELDGFQNLKLEELNLRIEAAIEKLPAQAKKAFTLCRFEYKSYKEISEILNISVKAVEGNISRALRHLRIELADYLPIILILKLFIDKG